MGLGKTIQAIAAAEIMARLLRRRARADRLPHVAQAPVAARDRALHRPHRDRSSAACGPRAQRIFAAESFFKITNYDTVHTDLDLIDAWAPDLVILDEAQRIKNWSTRVARSVKKITSPYAIVLTGTPLENRLEELISIVQFVDRYRLGPTFRLLHNHQVRDEAARWSAIAISTGSARRWSRSSLRRQKDQVLDQLPGADRQQRLRADDASCSGSTTRRTENSSPASCTNGGDTSFLSEADKRRLMIALQNMRMVCDSSYLLDHGDRIRASRPTKR